jgi:hypothetical protein
LIVLTHFDIPVVIHGLVLELFSLLLLLLLIPMVHIPSLYHP